MERIPEISEERLAELSRRIKPLVDRDGTLYRIKPCHPRNTAFSWDPEIVAVATGLKKLADITTYHTWAYYGFFKPSIAEVLAQIPEEFLGRCCAFSVEGPDTADDLNKHRKELNEGYHVAVTTLYEAETEPARANRYEIAVGRAL